MFLMISMFTIAACVGTVQSGAVPADIHVAPATVPAVVAAPPTVPVPPAVDADPEPVATPDVAPATLDPAFDMNGYSPAAPNSPAAIAMNDPSLVSLPGSAAYEDMNDPNRVHGPGSPEWCEMNGYPSPTCTAPSGQVHSS